MKSMRFDGIYNGKEAVRGGGVHIYIYIYMHTHTDMISSQRHAIIYKHVDMLYTYIYIYVYIYIYIHTHTKRSILGPALLQEKFLVYRYLLSDVGHFRSHAMIQCSRS